MSQFNIMVIDDEKIVGRMAQLSLEKEGYHVEIFTDGESALKRFKEKFFHVVVTDFKMKGIDGLEVLRTVKRLHPETAVIMITAFANLDVAVEALRDDVHDFFPKPVKIKEVKASIERALENFKKS
ncbi:MAG TPA: response regulator [Desulfobulbus sp.]|nr:response regulator [Desulfobulbus sp.]